MLSYINSLFRIQQHHWPEAVLAFFWKAYPWTIWLLPLSWIFYLLSRLRCFWWRCVLKPKKTKALSVCIGNVRVGGSGKTPFSITLIQHLILNGYNIAVVVKPYKTSQKLSSPLEVMSDSKVEQVGDEAMIFKKHVKACIIASPSKRKAIDFLEKNYADMYDIVLFDDGLQDPSVIYDMTMALFDDRNHPSALLPMGPLREIWDALLNYDYAFRVGYGENFYDEGRNYAFIKKPLRHIYHHHTKNIHFFDPEDRVIFISSVAYSEPIMARLTELCACVSIIELGDHGQISEAVFRKNLAHPQCFVVVTEKEYVKMQSYLQPSDPLWIISLESEIQKDILRRILNDIERKYYEKKIRGLGA